MSNFNISLKNQTEKVSGQRPKDHIEETSKLKKNKDKNVNFQNHKELGKPDKNY